MTTGPVGLALAAVALLAAAQQDWRPPSLVRPLALPPRVADWRETPLTQGGWTLRQGAAGSSAEFAPTAAPAQLVVRCDPARRSVRLMLRAASPAARPGATRVFIVRTSSHERRLAATGFAATVEAELPARDPLLDAVVFSRGRWALGIEAPASASGAAMLVLPVAPEVARIVEDCRN